MTRLLLVLACACLWLAACSSPTRSTSLSDLLVAPRGASSLLDQAQIDATIAALPNRNGYVTSDEGVRLFWRAFDPGNYGLQYRYAKADHENGKAMAMDLRLAPSAAFRPQPARGTVVLLHAG